MRVLVTGGSGRLGRSVLTAVAEAGHEPVCVDLVRPPAGQVPYESFAVDLLDTGECFSTVARYRPDAIVHLAAVPVPFLRTDVATFRTNTQMVFNVCQAAADLGVGTVLAASSPTLMGYGNPAGWQPDYLPLDEEHPTKPWNAYALSKVVAEETIQAFARRWPDRIACHAFRPCFVVSPEEWSGAPTQTGDTIEQRLDRPELASVSLFNYLDARDAGDFVAALLAKARDIPPGQVFFAGAQDALAREPLARLLPEHAGVSAESASGLTGTAPAFSSAKAERLLGWRAKRSWRTELR
ncbi:NAD-dependent epimerase/dehydratase family protein [Actinoalloteichus hymeniacidonis]|uniref:Nucleoside-diphosphate-sugar epimerase n=1 Tax=Actinoalloteichus hymeniacidonis TaxID=340345 RepID=A0AAC9N012_9PSEU|nr:NAD(P)-dependent oxidoreductase [Actinoalloteichus hymeniacidonis]AOS64920.1 nucleoside-diphosphate-sugar epimerase [Actinoalloteichus hymeniacidonis]MBB5907005.1 nucleoside-diphosphate-sugar epimerase [Actinoalloteichus hymeniacidonis]